MENLSLGKHTTTEFPSNWVEVPFRFRSRQKLTWDSTNVSQKISTVLPRPTPYLCEKQNWIPSNKVNLSVWQLTKGNHTNLLVSPQMVSPSQSFIGCIFTPMEVSNLLIVHEWRWIPKGTCGSPIWRRQIRRIILCMLVQLHRHSNTSTNMVTGYCWMLFLLGYRLPKINMNP